MAPFCVRRPRVTHPCLAGAIAVVIAAATVLPAHAAFEDLIGAWRGAEIIEDTGSGVSAEDLTWSIARVGNSVRVDGLIDGVLELDVRAMRSEFGDIYAEERHSMFGLFSEAAEPKLLAGERVFWARGIDDGAVLYHAVLSDTGTIDIVRVALIRTDEDEVELDVSRKLGSAPATTFKAILVPGP